MVTETPTPAAPLPKPTAPATTSAVSVLWAMTPTLSWAVTLAPPVIAALTVLSSTLVTIEPAPPSSPETATPAAITPIVPLETASSSTSCAFSAPPEMMAPTRGSPLLLSVIVSVATAAPAEASEPYPTASAPV